MRQSTERMKIGARHDSKVSSEIGAESMTAAASHMLCHSEVAFPFGRAGEKPCVEKKASHVVCNPKSRPPANLARNRAAPLAGQTPDLQQEHLNDHGTLS